MRYRFLLLLFFAVIFSNAQDFSGYRSGNNTGVNGVFFNPATIAGTGYKFDVNVFSISAGVANNQASFGLGDIGKSFNGDTLLNRFFPRNSNRSSSMVSVAAIGPSVMINLDHKSAFAITTRARVMMNAIDIDNKLARQLISDLDEGGITYPYTISSANNMVANANGWTEFGASYARTLLESGNHVLKAGITLKYLAGSANAYLNLSNLNTTVNRDLLLNPYLSNATGNIAIGFGGVNVADFKTGDLLKFKSSGFGGDIGIVYEWHKDNADATDYVLKAGAAFTDIGSIRYNRDQARSGAFTTNISGNQRFYLNEISSTDVDDIKATLRRYPQYFTENTAANAASYTVALPATLQLTADYHFQKSFYVNAAAQLAMTKSSGNEYNSQYYNAFIITPRFENRSFSFYLPLAYNGLSKFVAGFGLRAGPFFIGSGSIFSALFNSSKQVDAQVGLRFYGLGKK